MNFSMDESYQCLNVSLACLGSLGLFTRILCPVLVTGWSVRIANWLTRSTQLVPDGRKGRVSA